MGPFPPPPCSLLDRTAAGGIAEGLPLASAFCPGVSPRRRSKARLRKRARRGGYPLGLWPESITETLNNEQSTILPTPRARCVRPLGDVRRTLTRAAQEIAPDGQHIVGPYDYLFGYTPYYLSEDGTYGPMYYVINSPLGTVRKLGPDTFPFPIDAAYDPVHKVRYSLDGGFGTQAGYLWRTDLSGASTFIGNTGIGGSAYVPLAAYQPSTGRLYALYAGNGLCQLYVIDPATAHSDLVAQPALAQDVFSLCWDTHQSKIYGLAQGFAYDAVWIDPPSGDSSLLGIPNILAGGVQNGIGLAVDGADHLYAISYPIDNPEPPKLIVWPAASASTSAATDYVATPLHGDISGAAGPLQIFFAPPELMRPDLPCMQPASAIC